MKRLLGPLLILLSADLLAGTRHIERVAPRGGQRGTTVQVTIQGVELCDVRDAIFYRGGIEAIDFSAPKKISPRSLAHGGSIDQEVTCRFRIAADCPLGVHPFRLRTDRELTTVSTFRVTAYPVVPESETSRGKNDVPANAESLPSGNVTVAGYIQGDADCFKVSRRAGERISVEVDAVWLTEVAYGGAEHDLMVQISDEDGHVVAGNDDSILHVQDPIVSIITPHDGDYVVSVRQSVPIDMQVSYLAHIGTFVRPLLVFPPGGPGGTPLELRLLGDPAGDFMQSICLPFRGHSLEPFDRTESGVARDSDPTGIFELYPGPEEDRPPSPLPVRISPLTNIFETLYGVTDVKLPAALNGIIARPYEEDIYRITVKKGEAYRFEVFARTIGSALDPRVVVRRSGSDPNKIEVEGDDTLIGASRYYSASSSIHRKELLDPSFLWKPQEDGEYLVSVSDMRGSGGTTWAYRLEIGPTNDGVDTYLFARVFDSKQCPRLTALTVPRGNRWTVTFNLKEALGNEYQAEIELIAHGLPSGVEMVAPQIVAGQTSVPVQFIASNAALLQSALIDVQAAPVEFSKARRFISRAQESFPFLSHPGGRAWHSISVDRYVLAVTEPAPFTITLGAPRSALVRNGTLDLNVHVDRYEKFSGPVEVQAEWLPMGVSASPAMIIPPDKSDATFTLTAGSEARIGSTQIALIGSTTDGIEGGAYTGVGRVRVSTPLINFTVVDPYIDLKSQPTAVRRGQKSRLVWQVDHRRPFEGAATAALLGLPKGVRVGKPSQLLPGQVELAFEVEADLDTLLGFYRDLTCEVSIGENGQTIKQRVGRGVLRVDP